MPTKSSHSHTESCVAKSSVINVADLSDKTLFATIITDGIENVGPYKSHSMKQMITQEDRDKMYINEKNNKNLSSDAKSNK